MGILLFILTIAGATALFLYGMKLMSESIQKIFGERFRLILSAMSSNKARGVLTGAFIAALIHSSSATTVMVVSFVNAGILRLFEAVSIIMGANIGTTFTAWIIALFGFEFNFAVFTLPLIGISIPLLFSPGRKVRNWGEMLLGFSLLFIAVTFLKQHIPEVYDNKLSAFINVLSSFGYASSIVFLLAGTLVTVIIRSSSAVLVLTLVFVFTGWIGFENAAAMVLGENVGTTLGAIRAARIANVTAKRAAYTHLFFNLIGVAWAILLFPLFLKFVAGTYMYMGGGNPFLSNKDIPVALALFHTMFNFINMLLLVGFSRNMALFVSRRIHPGLQTEIGFRLTHIKTGLLSTPEASLYQARRETVLFAEKVRKMFINVERIYSVNNEKEFVLIKEKINKTEEFADRMETEIANYLTKVGEGRLSESSSKRMRALFNMIDDIESIADSCMNILNAIERKRNARIVFPEQINNNVTLIFSMVREALDMMVTMLTHDEELPLSMAIETEKELNNFRDILKREHLDNLERGTYKYDAGIIYNDIISQSERIGDYAMNVDESFKGLFN
jgi:phosphate:Na+ symporter